MSKFLLQVRLEKEENLFVPSERMILCDRLCLTVAMSLQVSLLDGVNWIGWFNAPFLLPVLGGGCCHEKSSKLCHGTEKVFNNISLASKTNSAAHCSNPSFPLPPVTRKTSSKIIISKIFLHLQLYIVDIDRCDSLMCCSSRS